MSNTNENPVVAPEQTPVNSTENVNNALFIKSEINRLNTEIDLFAKELIALEDSNATIDIIAKTKQDMELKRNERTELRNQQEALDAKYSGKTSNAQEEKDPFAHEGKQRLAI